MVEKRERRDSGYAKWPYVLRNPRRGLSGTRLAVDMAKEERRNDVSFEGAAKIVVGVSQWRICSFIADIKRELASFRNWYWAKIDRSANGAAHYPCSVGCSCRVLGEPEWGSYPSPG